MKWFTIDDDFLKLLPQNIPSKIIWDELQEDFGASEIMLIAFGNKDISIYRKEIFLNIIPYFPESCHRVHLNRFWSDCITYLLPK